MTKKPINQNDSYKLELLNSINSDFIFNSYPINRLKNKNNTNYSLNEEKTKSLDNLKQEINSIKNCKLKDNADYLGFGYGNISSSLMIISGTPSKKNDENNKSFSEENSLLLKKMLAAINIKKENIYSTYAVNYQTPNDRKPTTDEINKYSNFLKKHIAIINPKIIILMGSTAMEALTGLNNKISIERGKWKEVIVKNTNYNVIITFSSSYLLRFPENKKYAWEDLKKIKKKITDLNLNI
jgi:uracil-DNA glycosylase